MENPPVLNFLKAGCEELQLPKETAIELVRFLIAKRLVGQEKGQLLSPSAKLDKLQHWVLLNTEIRDEIESLLAWRISHSSSTAKLDEISKCGRRLQSMNAMAAVLGCNVQIGLWQEDNTLMHEVKAVKISKAGTDESFKMYCTKMLGRAEILQQLAKEGYSCSKDDWIKLKESHNEVLEQRKKIPASEEILRMDIIIRFYNSTETRFTIRTDMLVGQFLSKAAVRQRSGGEVFSLVTAEGYALDPQRTFSSYPDIEDGDKIDALVRQEGG